MVKTKRINREKLLKAAMEMHDFIEQYPRTKAIAWPTPAKVAAWGEIISAMKRQGE